MRHKKFWEEHYEHKDSQYKVPENPWRRVVKGRWGPVMQGLVDHSQQIATVDI